MPAPAASSRPQPRARRASWGWIRLQGIWWVGISAWPRYRSRTPLASGSPDGSAVASASGLGAARRARRAAGRDGLVVTDWMLPPTRSRDPEWTAGQLAARTIRVTVVPQWGQVPSRAQWPERSIDRLMVRRSTAQWHW